MKNDDLEEYTVGVLNVSIEDNLANITHLYNPTKDEVSRYLESVAKLNYLLKDDSDIYTLFQYSYNRFNDTYLYFKHAFEVAPRPYVNNALLELNAGFLSFLNFMKTYLDYSSTRHHHGLKDIDKKKSMYTKLTSNYYDSSFSYRFCYKLRNYAQHCGFPITGFNATSGFKEGTTEEVHSYSVYFKKDELLSKYDSWGSVIKKELKDKPDEMDVKPIVEELFNDISALRLELLKETVSKISKEYQAVKNLYDHTSTHLGTPLLIRMYEPIKNSSGQQMKVEQNVIPVNLLELIEKVMSLSSKS